MDQHMAPSRRFRSEPCRFCAHTSYPSKRSRTEISFNTEPNGIRETGPKVANCVLNITAGADGKIKTTSPRKALDLVNSQRKTANHGFGWAEVPNSPPPVGKLGIRNAEQLA